MKTFSNIFPILILIVMFSCKGEDRSIVHRNFNSEIILNRQQFDTTSISPIPCPELGELIGTGEITFDISGDGTNDIAFEIIDLHYYNGTMPDTLDSLAVRARGITVDILDNSTYGYADALTQDASIGGSGNWSGNTVVLGTFAGAGQFNGHGEKYMGIKLKEGSNLFFGWVKLYCSVHNDTLKVISIGYNESAGDEVFAGE
ncbi:MAG: hypothetical protein JXR53_03255 [Bacteroidales bacterium]|nr:hypothetical protein [Bacteroidales bacterium]